MTTRTMVVTDTAGREMSGIWTCSGGYNWHNLAMKWLYEVAEKRWPLNDSWVHLEHRAYDDAISSDGKDRQKSNLGRE